MQTEEKEPHCTCPTLGGNLINYHEDVGAPMVDLLLIKIFLNSVILTLNARFANADISNYHLNTLLQRPKYAKIKLSPMPEEISIQYKLQEKATHDGWIYIKCAKGMYSLLQAGSLANELLE